MEESTKKNLIGAGAGVATGLLGMIGQRTREKRAIDNQKKLMEVQLKNQQTLNEQGQALQMKTWEETNYPAQMKMLEKAGLNPALLYGQGGPGGTTGGQGGGSAQSGSAPSPQPMELGTALQAAMMQSTIELQKSQARKNEVEADNLQGKEGTIGATTIMKLIEETNSEKSKQNLMKAQEVLNGYTTENIRQNTENLRQILKNIEIDTSINEATKGNQIDIIKNEARSTALDILLKQTNINLGEARINEIKRTLGQKDKSLDIQKFAKEIEAEFPTTGKVIGKALNELYDMFGGMTERDENERTRKATNEMW